MECCICFDYFTNTRHVPCGHNDFCLKCSLSLILTNNYVCPLCRSIIKGIHFDNRLYTINELLMIIFCGTLVIENNGMLKNRIEVLDYIEHLEKETILAERRMLLNKAMQYCLLDFDRVNKFIKALFPYFQ